MRLGRASSADSDEIRLRALALPDTLDLPTLQALISERRGRPLYVQPMPEAADEHRPFGAWIALADRDVLFYEPATSPAHRAHIVLHEMAHVLCGHTPTPGGLAALFPDVDQRVLGAMFRHDYADDIEQEAEQVALALRRRIERTNAGRRASDTAWRTRDALIHPRRALGAR